MHQVFLNALGKVDRTFFLVCLIGIGLIVLVYFLIPVINRKQYQEARENLKKREAAFKGNVTKVQEVEEPKEQVEEQVQEDSKTEHLEK